MKKLFKSTILVISLLIIFGFFAFTFQHAVFAEQSGSSPESGATSRIKTINNSLVSLSHGSESAGGWGNWGTYWNRIRSAAEWVPSGNATEADVASGKTFYKDSRTQQTGTASLAPDWSTFSKVTWDDNKNTSSADGDTANEEATWTNTAGSATTGVWKDLRTGLYWTPMIDANTNNFTVATCDFYTTVPRGSYAGGDSDCGGVINACASLSLEAVTGGGAKTDWYLPSQKELQQAYIDGINNTNTTFVSNSYFFSSTENSGNSAEAWTVQLKVGYLYNNAKTDYYEYRCIRRD